VEGIMEDEELKIELPRKKRRKYFFGLWI